MKKLIILPQKIEIECKDSEPLFNAAIRNNVSIKNSCGGKGSCGTCVVKIVEGNKYLNIPNKTEEKHLGNTYYLTKKRLSCQCIFLQDGEVKIEV